MYKLNIFMHGLSTYIFPSKNINTTMILLIYKVS